MRGIIPNGTKDGEYYRTIDKLEEMITSNKESDKSLRALLWFLHDCQYNREDLGRMAELLDEKIRLRVNSSSSFCDEDIEDEDDEDIEMFVLGFFTGKLF